MQQTYSTFSGFENSSIIRTAKIEDIKSIYRIEVESFLDPYPPSVLINLLLITREGFLVVETQGTIVGYTILRKVGVRGHLMALAIDKRFQKKGFGTRLLDHAMKVLEASGCHGIWLEVRSSNMQAKRFYMNRKFKQITRIDDYYSDGEDADVLYRVLSS